MTQRQLVEPTHESLGADMLSVTPDFGYSPSLDGLRAIAVIAVIAYHAGASWLPGGFLGVDLFFVLSGFLITTLLLDEFRRWGSIDLLAFWGRRVRRLVPALLVVTAATLVVAWLVGSSRGGSNGRDALASLLYVNNWNQVATQTNYFDQFLGASPFLHTWSLAIEEQFYLVWPPVLAFLLARRADAARMLPGLLIAVAVVSAALMVLRYDPANPTAAYVSTDTRIQTIACGALGAALMASPAAPRIRQWMHLRPLTSTVIAAVVLLALGAAMALASESSEWLFRGGFLALALAVAGLLVLVAHGPRTAVTTVLSWRPLVAIGLISYGLYLWHWPVFALLGPSVLPLTGLALVAAQCAVTVALALASYWLIERPVRRRWFRDRYGKRAESMGLVIGTASVAALSLVVLTTLPAVATDGSTADVSVGTGNVSVFLYGDSVSFGLRRDFEPTLHSGLALSGSSALGCPAFPVTNFINNKPDPPKANCQEWYSGWAAELQKAKPTVSVLPSSQWLLYDPYVDGKALTLGSPEWATYLTAQYDQYVDAMKAQSQHVVLLNQPCYRVYNDGTSAYATTIDDDTRVKTYNDFLAGYAKSRGLPLLDFNNWLCGPGKDPEWVNGTKMRVEGLHFTYEGAQLVWNWLAPELEAIAAGKRPASLVASTGKTTSG